MAVTAMMMTAWTATAAMPRVTTIAVMTAINAVMSAPAMTGRVTIVPAMTVSVVAGMIATGMAAAVMTVPVTNVPVMIALVMTVPVTNVRVTSARVKTVPVKIGHVKIGHVKIVAPMATAVIGSVIAVIAGRNGQSSRGIRIQLMHRRSMTANRFCRRCHPPSRAARAVA